MPAQGHSGAVQRTPVAIQVVPCRCQIRQCRGQASTGIRKQQSVAAGKASAGIHLHGTPSGGRNDPVTQRLRQGRRAIAAATIDDDDVGTNARSACKAVKQSTMLAASLNVDTMMVRDKRGSMSNRHYQWLTASSG